MFPSLQYAEVVLLQLAVWHTVTGSESPMFVNVVSFKAVSEDTPVNTTLFTLNATDQDGPEQLLFTIPTTHPSYLIVWLNNVRGDSKTGRMVDVLLKSPLDRDFTNQQTVRLLFAVQDSSTMETANRINQGVELLILDVNDENPTFNQSRYELSVLESTTLDSSVMTLKASDPDSNPQLRYFMEPVGQAVSDMYRNSFVIEPLTGQIKVNRKLDYNVNNFYEFTLMVNDNGGNGGRNGTASLLIKIIDVQDKPPYFINLPYRVNILENATIGTKVLQVTAFDGDKGVPNTSVSYSFDSGDTSLFAINNDTGDITVKSQLDRDNPNIQQTGGVYALGVKATENNNNQPANMTTAVTLVTIKVDDVNDNSPTFPLRVYQASILENMQEGVPITFNSPAVMNVSDIDQGLNSHFALSLEMNGKLYTDFSPLPSEVYSESSVLIQVRNQSALDFELLPEITFQIIAREIGTDELRSGSATIVLKIIDMNDNSPIFDPNMKTSLSILENSTSGTELTTLYATDLDSGNNGKITYNIRGSNSVFNVNATSGRVTLTGQLNREVVDRYLLTAEAKDGGGLITFVTLNVTVLDVNDVRPSFTRDEYYVTVPEDRTEFLRGDLVVKAIDDDEPNSPNSRVHYRIKSASAGLAGKFAVDNTSGLVTMVARIDYESLPVSVAGRAGPVLVEIEAYDLGVPSLATSINITVEVEDVNDNAPTFNKTFYSASVSEMALAGTSVIQVFASDSDRTPPNNQFLYRIDSGASDKFRINFQTGEITVEVGARLDYESVPKYVLNITATDRGAVPQEGLCVVEISILDENDEAPVFIPTSVTTAVSENTLPGGEVKCLTAVDLDSNPVLVYSLLPSSVLGYDESGRAVNVTSTGAQNYFKINSTSGCIQVQSKLDRETVELVILKAIVVDTQAVSGHINQTATGTVTITVSDYNDNAPQFIPNNTYSLLISEGLNLHSEVMRFETRDLDKQQQVSYRIHMDPYGNFDITPSTGILRLKSRLDRETYPSIQLRVLAVDSGLPQLTSTAVVSVTVQDINDNSPVFLPYELQYSVREDDAPDTVICRLSATDADLGEYGRIEYKFEVSNDDGRLKINKTTGAISVASLLDREKRNSYTLYVQANDNPGTPEDQRTNQTKTIIIKVTDVNDNDPAFTNIEENTRPSVLENDSPGRVVFTVSADDLDEGVNAELQYSLSGDPESLFTLKNINRNISGIPKYFGEISVAKSLIGESGTHQLVITVTDKGTSPRSANTTLIILVNDVNLHAPVFVSPSEANATISAYESPKDETERRSIFNITARDDDKGVNKQIYFSILPEADWQTFVLERCTFEGCELKNRLPLDRETRPTYLIKIKAEDSGVPKNFSTILTLNIIVLDIDDELPEFTDDRSEPYRIQPHRIQIAEGQTQSYTNLNIAIDKDAGNNSIICYYIIGGDDIVKQKFRLEQTGRLALVSPLDREALTQPFISMVIYATPRCFQDIPEYSRPSVYPPQNYAMNRTILWVQVEVADINDNPPVFKQSVLTLGVSRDTGYKTAIANLQDLITDADATMKVEFYELRTEQYLQGTKLSTNQPFEVFKNGTVATNVFFQANMYGYFLVFVQAKENVTGGPPYLANATLRISLINDDQRLKVIIRNSPEVVRGFQVEFTQKLSNVTGYRIVVDKIQVHDTGSQEGQVNQNMTDMFIHGEDMKTNETIPAAELRRVIDSLADELYQFKYNYKVIEIVMTSSVSQAQTLEDEFKMALILVAIILTLMCVVIIVIFIISRRQYKRKLKAATALAYGSNTDLHKLELPGTNVHAYENANPIYLEKIQLEEAGEQNDDEDSLDNNAVESGSNPQKEEQNISMNLYSDNNNLNKTSQSKLRNGDSILTAAIQQHQKDKVSNGSTKPVNGHLETKRDNFEGLPTTEI
ncbi:cadherin-23-like isoform X2 [Dreissena polymorpha]|uniref:cadherin-23-like isoform X2 n=1 Tax=Dreissena polymorpha TaxID=45954 RepID=UPI002263DEEA|nr:cadherin-23-like isoform X2 [Dreissena polymorpha]